MASDRLSRDTWIRGGLGLLARRGVVAIEPLARVLGVTKGSFYWHFAGLAEFKEILRRRWVEEATDTFIAQVEQLPTGPGERLRQLLLLTASVPKPLERAVRAWAVKDPETAACVRMVDDRRTDFVRGLLLGIGHEAAAAEALARLVACFVVGETARGLAAEPAHREIYAALLTRK